LGLEGSAADQIIGQGIRGKNGEAQQTDRYGPKEITHNVVLYKF
jgi:hypothetical protein